MRHLRKSLRMAGLFPIMYFLKTQVTKTRRFLPLQPRTQIRVLVKDFHFMGLGTEGIVHPSQDPFSRARLPYLEASPSRFVGGSIVRRLTGWEKAVFSYYPFEKELN
jgi:hypothetical protein